MRLDERRLELLSAVLLALATVATAWAAFQAREWTGEQTHQNSQGQAARITQNRVAAQAASQEQVDIATFIQWLDARAQHRFRLAAFYRERFRPEFEPAFTAWLATRPFGEAGAPLTPFAMPQYRLAASAKAAQLEQQAATATARAQSANRHANDDMLAVVLFATALFFAGISAKLHSLRVRAALLGFGWLVFLATAIWLVSLPAQFG